MTISNQSSDQIIEDLLREMAPQVLGIVVRKYHDFAMAEDAVQESLLAAVAQWPKDGVPDNPRAWLVQVAFHRMADLVRSESARHRRETKVAQEADLFVQPPCDHFAMDEDDTLILLFMCCHPALTPASSIALTLRAVGGLTTAEIGHAFLVPEATMAQRISRAKQTIKNSQAPFELPGPEERAQRLRSVLHVLYLIFNEGYTSTSGPNLRRDDLAHEAIRLTRLVHQRSANDPEVEGLLALMLLTDARRQARTNEDGALIPIDQQDRTLWNQQQIAEGIDLLSGALPKGLIGPYQLQAAIAAVHDEAACAEDTDLPQILALYDLLKRMSNNPTVKLNHAIAAAAVHGPERGLELLRSLDSETGLTHQHRVDATRAHLLELCGDREGALRYYRLAASKTGNLAERNYLLTQAARLKSSKREGPDDEM